ncbi:MAG: POTRA domain-containing protein [Bacteroidota bacterium]|nr:POTRA domain-containing protein [Bacteroidota bacterium]
MQPCLSDSASSHQMVVGRISLEGNQITKSKIIFREIVVKEGDTLSDALFKNKLEQSRLNLLNTSLFNFVNIDTTHGINGTTNLNFRMVERWYLFPIPIFEISDRNFNTWLEHKDWRRINYGGYLKWSNLRGRMEVLNLLIRFGYDEKYRLTYDFPYINPRQTLGLSIVSSVTQNHEVSYLTQNNKQLFYRGENYLLRNTLASIGLNYRPSIFEYFSSIIGYNRFDYDSKLTELNNAYAPTNANHLNLLFGTLYYRNDHRDNKPYPIQGYYTDLNLTSQFGSYNNGQEYSNKFLYSTVNTYDRIDQRWSWAAGITFKLSQNQNAPYFLNQGFGFHKDYVRGYEYYVVDGGTYLLGRTNLKYNLVKPHTGYVKLTGSEKFDKIHYAAYFNIFADLGEVFSQARQEAATLPPVNATKPLNNQLLRGYGVGLDLVTYYDRVLRVEYSFNHYGQSGIFIHFDTSL